MDEVLAESLRLTGNDADFLRALYPGQSDLLLSCWMAQFGYDAQDVSGPTGDRLLNCFLNFFGIDTPQVRIFDTFDALCCCFYQYLGFIPSDVPKEETDKILWMLRHSGDIPSRAPIRCRVGDDGRLYFYTDTALVPNFGAGVDGDGNLTVTYDDPPVSGMAKTGQDHITYNFTE